MSQVILLNRFFYPDHSATSQMLSDLAFHLALSGHMVTVITSRQRYDDPGAELPARERIRNVEVHRVRTPAFGRSNLAGRLFDYLGFCAAASIRLWHLARSGDIVVAKTDPPLISIPAAWIARRRHAHLVNWLQDLFPEVAIALGVQGINGFIGRGLLRMRNWSLRQADMNVTIGDLMRERILAESVPANRVSVIPNWADGDAITPVAHEDNPLRRAWGLDGKFVVGYSGNLGRAHEFETILGAAELLRNNPSIRFLFIGSGAQAASVRGAAANRGLDNFAFQPYQPREMLRFSLGAADAHLVVLRPELEGLIVPSKTYGCLASARPIVFIGDSKGETGRFLDASGAGYVCPIGNAAALAQIVLDLAAARSVDIGTVGRAEFEKHFEKKIALERFAMIFRSLKRHAN